jgi:hypothetical protein
VPGRVILHVSQSVGSRHACEDDGLETGVFGSSKRALVREGYNNWEDEWVVHVFSNGELCLWNT